MTRRKWGHTRTDMEPAMLSALQDPGTTPAYNSHSKGVEPHHLEDSPAVDFFEILATSVDPNTGNPFVAMFEAPKYPFFGVQFHPEKCVWEHGMTPSGTSYQNIPHDANAVRTTLYFSQFFVEQAKASKHRFDDQDQENASLIWQYPVFATGEEFVQSYVAAFGRGAVL